MSDFSIPDPIEIVPSTAPIAPVSYYSFSAILSSPLFLFSILVIALIILYIVVWYTNDSKAKEHRLLKHELKEYQRYAKNLV